jgi:uncharacterized protein YbaA (DUF1428 family)
MSRQETKMQATITYLLTEQAQREQMAATGQPVARKQVITIEVAPEDLELFPVAGDGSITVDLTSVMAGSNGIGRAFRASGTVETWNGGSGIYFSGVPDLAQVRVGRAKLAEAAEEEARVLAENGEHNRQLTEAAYRKFMADPSARSGELYDRIRALVRQLGEGDIQGPANWWPEKHDALRVEIERRNAADRAAKDVAELAKEQAKSNFIEAWISEHGTDEDRDQFADGLLSRKAALALIADAAFAEHGVPEPATEPHVCKDSDCPCGSADVDALPRSVYPAWRALKAKLPEGYAVTFDRVRECLRDDGWDGEGESAAPPYYTAEITIPCGPFQFTRTVKL